MNRITDSLKIGARIEIIDYPGPQYAPGDTATVLGWDSMSILCRFDPSPTVDESHIDEAVAVIDLDDYARVWWVGHESENTKILEATP